MISLRKIFLFVFIIMSFLKSELTFAQNISIIPQPQKIENLNEKFLINSELSIKVFFKDTSNIYIPIKELQETFKLFKGFIPSTKTDFKKVIYLGIPNENKSFKKLCEENDVSLNDSIGTEGYVLLIKKNKIIIASKTKTGVYYGVQSLKQLIRADKNSKYLHGLKITDWPDLKYRGILDDISRGPLPTMDFMKKQIRRFAELKMNWLQYYTENVVMTKSHPDFAPPDGSITIEEWKELADYARKYHIMLVGNFQSFGHFEKILANPNYTHLGEGGSLLSPAFPESIKLLKDIYSEMVPAFNAPFFNVNADETFELGKGVSKTMVDSLGIAVVYTDQIKKMYKILKGLGVRMMMWDDILLKHPESLEMIPKDIILMTWGYDASESFDDMIEPVKNAGFQFTISPGILNSYSTMPNYSIAIPNIHNFVRDGIKYGAMGMVCTVWDDGGSAFFSKDWYGVSYAADQSWNSSDENISVFNNNFNRLIYGDTTNSFTSAIWKLVSLANISASDGLQEKLLWTKVIPDSGESIRIGIEDWDKVISVVDSAEDILNNSKPTLYKSDYDYFQFTIDQYRYFADLRFNLIKAAKLYSEAYNNFKIKKTSSRKQIVEAIKVISNSINSLTKLYNNYRILWLGENKTYSVNDILQKYQAQENDLKDIQARIFSALRRLDSRLDIPSPLEVRLGIDEGVGKYFRDWMMINPIPIENKNYNIDFLKDMGGETNAAPKVTQLFDYNGETYRWRRTYSDLFDVVDLSELFPNDSNSVTYAHANITSPDVRIVTASLGSTDGVDVFINGKKVFSSRKKRKLIVDQDKFKMTLKKGKNNLLLKLFHGKGDWKFTFQLLESEVSNSKNRYKIRE